MHNDVELPSSTSYRLSLGWQSDSEDEDEHIRRAVQRGRVVPDDDDDDDDDEESAMDMANDAAVAVADDETDEQGDNEQVRRAHADSNL